MQEKTFVQDIARTIYQKKGFDIVVLDVAHLTVITDYMVIASGRSANQVKALYDEVDECMAERGLMLRRCEGQSEGRWIVMDYGPILVQLFHQEEREFYNLERLWSDGTNRVELTFNQDED